MPIADIEKELRARDPVRADVVAFLQNPWFKPGTDQRVIRLYMECASYRRMVLALSATGRALMEAFGDFYCQIWWDNACPLPGQERAASFPPDVEHIREVVKRLKPKIVLCFGRSAEIGFRQVGGAMPMTCCHPMAHGDRREELRLFAERVRRQVEFFDLMREGASR